MFCTLILFYLWYLLFWLKKVLHALFNETFYVFFIFYFNDFSRVILIILIGFVAIRSASGCYFSRFGCLWMLFFKPESS